LRNCAIITAFSKKFSENEETKFQEHSQEIALKSRSHAFRTGGFVSPRHPEGLS